MMQFSIIYWVIAVVIVIILLAFLEVVYKLLKQKNICSLVTLIIIVLVGVVSFYFNNDRYGASVLESQLNQLVKEKNIADIKKYAQTPASAEFLMQVPENIKCSKTSDSQGVNSKGELYFVTELNKYHLDVYMKKDTGSSIFGRLFPEWSLSGFRI